MALKKPSKVAMTLAKYIEYLSEFTDRGWGSVIVCNMRGDGLLQNAEPPELVLRNEQGKMLKSFSGSQVVVPAKEKGEVVIWV